MEKISMSLMEEPIAARGAYFVFLYILVTVPKNSCWLLVKPAHFFSALNASTTTMYLWASLSITYTVYFSTLSIDFYHDCSFLCPSLPFFGAFELWVSGLESWMEQYDRKMQPHHFLRGNFQKIWSFVDFLCWKIR